MNHHRTAGLVLAEQALHQFDPLLGELRVKDDARIGFLRFFDLVDFVGGKEITPLRQQCAGKQENCNPCLHFFFPSIRPTKSSSWTFWIFLIVGSSIGRSSKLISRWNVSRRRSRSRVAISACLKYFGLL